MDELILIRHAQAGHLEKGLTGGWTDLALTRRGHRQAELAGRRLAQLLGDRSFLFYCSDLKRSLQTAEIIGRVIGREPVATRALRDTNNGIAAHMDRARAMELRLPITSPILDWIPFPGAESWRMLLERVVPFLEAMHRRPESVGVLVAHSNVIITAIHWWLEFPEDLIVKTSFAAEPASLARLTIDDWGSKTIARLNDTAHLLCPEQIDQAEP